MFQKVKKSSHTAPSALATGSTTTPTPPPASAPARKRRHEQETQEQNAPAEKRRKEERRTEEVETVGSVLNCDLGGNFDYSSIDLSGEESDDLDINFY